MNFEWALFNQNIRLERKRLAKACCSPRERFGVDPIREELDKLYWHRHKMEEDAAIVRYFEKKEG